MKLFFIILILILFQNCSFDKNSGIWKNEEVTDDKRSKKIFEGFVDLNNEQKIFNQIIQSNRKLRLQSELKQLDKLNDYSLNEINNFNFKFKESNNQIFKSKKLSKYGMNKNIYFDEDNLITSDIKGNIIIYSIKKRKLRKFNFYKKTHKTINKKLNLIVKDKIIYVTDNIGFMYAYSFIDNKVLWAKRYKAPFRSNLKIYKKKIITSDQNNSLFFIERDTGKEIKKIPTEQVNFNNDFVNNIAINENKFFYLNSYGSLYSIDEKMNINWFINLNQKTKDNPSSIFFSNEIIIYKKNIFVLTNNQLYIIDKSNGAILFKKNFGSNLAPLIFKDYIFFINNKNLFVSFSIKDKKIVYSYDFKSKFKINSKFNKNSYDVRNLFIVNNSIYFFLNEPYIFKINFDGILEKKFKINTYLNSNPIFINNSLLFLNNKNKLIVIN